jgi:hypothetical protein
MSFTADIGAAGIGSTIGAGITGAFGAFLGGEAQQQYYNYQAGVAQFNAQIAQQNAQYEINLGEIQAQQAGLQQGQQMGRIIAGQGASGLDVNSGSAKQVQQSQIGLNRTAQTSIRSSAAKQAYNYEVEGAQFSAQAVADTQAGKNARTAGMLGVTTSLLGAASSVSSEWLKSSTLNLFSNSTPSSGGIGMF